MDKFALFTYAGGMLSKRQIILNLPDSQEILPVKLSLTYLLCNLTK